MLAGRLLTHSCVLCKIFSGNVKLTGKNPAYVYHPDAALSGHLWEARGTEEVKGK